MIKWIFQFEGIRLIGTLAYGNGHTAGHVFQFWRKKSAEHLPWIAIKLGIVDRYAFNFLTGIDECGYRGKCDKAVVHQYRFYRIEIVSEIHYSKYTRFKSIFWPTVRQYCANTFDMGLPSHRRDKSQPSNTHRHVFLAIYPSITSVFPT